MKRHIPSRWFILSVIAVTLVSHSQADDRNTGAWNLSTLYQVPEASWGEEHEGIREVYFQGEPYQGRPARVFAYYGQPSGEGPFPAMVLIHGGGATAYPEWVRLWAARGYAAIAMDLAGCGPDKKPLADGGPGQGHDMKFVTFTGENVKDICITRSIPGHGRSVAGRPGTPRSPAIGFRLTCSLHARWRVISV